MHISDREEHKTVVHQENLVIYVQNVDKNIKKIWRPIYEVIYVTFFKKQTLSTTFLRLT